MDQDFSTQPLSNAELKTKLDEVARELDHFDELTTTIEEQQKLANLEKQVADPNV